MRREVPLGILAALAALAATRSAHATPSARLVYARSVDAATCPDEAALRKAVAARFGYDPFFAWAKQTVVVQVSRENGRYAARVQVVDDRGLAHGTREIASDEDNCSELFDAAALAISIALDASIHVPAPPAPEEQVVRPAPLAAPAPISEMKPQLASVHETPPAGASPAASPFRIGVGAMASALVAPHLAPGITAFGDFRTHTLSLGLEFQADLSIPKGEALTLGVPSLGYVMSALLTAAIAPCIHYGPTFICALGEIGWLQGWGWNVAQGRSNGAPFVAAGGRVGAEWPLWGGLFVRVHADLLANLDPVDFRLDNQRVWAAQPVVGALGMGFGVPLP